MIMLCIKKANDLHLASYNNKCQPTRRVMMKSYLFVFLNFFETLAQICRSA